MSKLLIGGVIECRTSKEAAAVASTIASIINKYKPCVSMLKGEMAELVMAPG